MLPRFGWALSRFAAAPSRTLLLRGARPLGTSPALLKPEAPKPAVPSIRNSLVEKIGVTGPWTLGVGVALYVIGQELYVFNSETVILAVVGGVIWWVMRKVGTPVAEFLDNRSQNILGLLNEGKSKKIQVLEDSIAKEKEVEAQLEARHDLFEVFLENNQMLLEEEYRRRMHEVNTEVKKRLDYHVEVEQAERQFEQTHMVEWLERQVTEAMKTKQDESLAQCVNDLKKMSVA